MSRVPISRSLPLALALALVAAAPAQANWERQTTHSVQQTTLNASQQSDLQRTSLTAVAASGIAASAPLIQQGAWNPAVIYSPAVQGGTFSLLLTSEAAGSVSSHSVSRSPNRLEASRQPDGRLQAGPGSSASEVQLTVTQTYSVF
jgi:hypothetical protein